MPDGAEIKNGQRPVSKRFGHRICSVDHTLSRVSPFLDIMGITRLADVTGLDHVGIPMAQAIRPMGRSLSVAQGKGMTLNAAFVSAMMEAAEGWHAETIVLPRRTSCQAKMEEGINVSAASVVRPVSNHIDLDWVEGRDCLSGDVVWVPFDLVSKDYTCPAADSAFVRTTNGLASGNTWHEAIASALHEVIERDCLADHHWRDAAQVGARRRSRAFCRAVGADVRWLLDKIDAAELRLDVWDITNDLGVPCFHAQLYETTFGTARPCRPPSSGSGCHLDPQVALVRAVTEAAQGRLTEIAGSRDDLLSDRYRPVADGNVVAMVEAAMDIDALTSQQQVPVNLASCISPAEDCDELSDRLARHGVTQAAIVDLSKPELPLSVVRAVVPGLGFPTSKGFVLGRRERRIGI